MFRKIILVAAMLAVGACTTQQAAKDPYAKPGFFTQVKDGRLWVFKDGTKELETFKKTGEPAHQVTRIAAGPGGITLKSSDAKTIDDYLAAK